MKKIFFSTNQNTIQRFKELDNKIEDIHYFNDLLEYLNDDTIVLIDYDSVSSKFNKLLNSGKIPQKTIVLESVPAIQTGKMLISHGVKAYGNINIHNIHYNQMIETVSNNKIWTYPELTASLTKNSMKLPLTKDAKKLINLKLTPKEKEVVFLILDGLTNEAIAEKMNISIRTVKAHISSIFEKLHVNDRLTLALLLVIS